VGQLAAGLPVSRSAVSQDLKILKDAGLVQDVVAGTRRIYRSVGASWTGPRTAASAGGRGSWPQGWPLYLDRYAALVKETS
jgi:DNA-binding transcriptional ArsR family regulator